MVSKACSSTHRSAIASASRLIMAGSGPFHDKQTARKAVQDALKATSAAAMADESAAAAAHLLSTEFMRRANRVAIYVHCPSLREVDTGAVLRSALFAGSKVYVPRVQDTDANMHFLRISHEQELRPVPPFGILEPWPHYEDGTLREDALEADSALDVVVMPGLAFDRAGRRLGRGGGYYDKFIEACHRRAEERGWHPPLLAAMAFRSQMIEEVPVAEHDRHVDLLVTADGIHTCSARGRAVSRPVLGAGGNER